MKQLLSVNLLWEAATTIAAFLVAVASGSRNCSRGDLQPRRRHQQSGAHRRRRGLSGPRPGQSFERPCPMDGY